MAEELFRKKISKEERMYQEAVKLQQAIPCVLRFEHKEAALKSAARKFQRLGEYKDAKARLASCRAAAAETLSKGRQEVFENALLREQKAKCKSDYADAIAEFGRVLGRGAYGQEAKAHIQACKQKIARLESLAVWKRRLLAVAIACGCVFLFMLTPLYPFAKGYACQQMGRYEAALVHYKEAGSLSWSKDLSGVCYLKMGREKAALGEKEQALRLFRKAAKKGNRQAKQEMKKIEIE